MMKAHVNCTNCAHKHISKVYIKKKWTFCAYKHPTKTRSEEDERPHAFTYTHTHNIEHRCH